MAQAAIKTVHEMDAEPASGTAIDRDHLARMTFGDHGLERELLELFDRQAAILVGRMRSVDAASIAALAHTLKGSAVGVGATAVAQAAAAVEQASGPQALAATLDRLAAAVEAARRHIAELLGAG